MEINVSETPERWVILKSHNNRYKVFGTWSGGYLDGDRWRLNSGIKKVEQDEDFYYFIGFSGSCYKCHKKRYGTATSFGLSILNKITEQGNGKLKLIEDVDDWGNVIHDVICCGYFEKLLQNFRWFSIQTEEGEKLCMPYILTENEKIRVNNCPVCGKEVRSVEIKPELLSHCITTSRCQENDY